MKKDKIKKILLIIISIIIFVLFVYFSVIYLKNKRNYYTNLAYQYYLKGENVQSQESYESAKKFWILEPEDNFYYALSLYINKSDLDSAIKRYTLAYDGGYEPYISLTSIGNCYRDKGNYLKAKEYYEKAIFADNTKIDAYLNIIELTYNKKENYLDWTQKALDNLGTSENKIKIYLKLINIYLKDEDIGNVVKYSKEILELDENNQLAKKYILEYE